MLTDNFLSHMTACTAVFTLPMWCGADAKYLRSIEPLSIGDHGAQRISGHSFGTRLINRFVPLAALQAQPGH